MVFFPLWFCWIEAHLLFTCCLTLHGLCESQLCWPPPAPTRVLIWKILLHEVTVALHLFKKNLYFLNFICEVSEQVCKGSKEKSFFTTLKVVPVPRMNFAMFMVYLDPGFLRQWGSTKMSYTFLKGADFNQIILKIIFAMIVVCFAKERYRVLWDCWIMGINSEL